MRSTRATALLLALVFVLVATPLRAEEAPAFTSPGATETWSSPRPSGLLPSSLFDPSRFSISHSATFGYTSGGGYQGSSGLWTSSLGYKIRNNTMLRVDVGAHMNPAFGGGEMQKGVFLQGATLDWKPSNNSLVRFEYRDVRSPMQAGWGYGYNGYGYGYGSPNYGFVGPSSSGSEVPVGSGLPGDPMRN